MRATPSSLALGLIVFIAGCASDRDGDEAIGLEPRPAPSGQSLYVRQNLLWGHTILVCWEDSSYPLERGWAQSAVEAAWESTGDVDFIGWSFCVTGFRGLRVRMRNGGGSTKGLGIQLNGIADGVSLDSWGTYTTPVSCDPTFTRRECVESTAVHEFGHALGFAHEQNRDDDGDLVADYLELGSCTENTQGSCEPGEPCTGGVSFGAWDLDSVMNYCNPERNGRGKLSRIDVAGLRAFYGKPWIADFGLDAGGWLVSRHPRFVADVNGDGRDDVGGFGNDGVYLSISNGDSFTNHGLVLEAFGYDAGGWRVERHPRMLADVSGDGKADIVAFGEDGVYLALSANSGFRYLGRVLNTFGHANGWQVETSLRMVADVNADGKADIVGFGQDGVYLALSTGSSFANRGRVLDAFGCSTSEWAVTEHPRMLADVNGDRRADIVGFGSDGVYVARSTGWGFARPTRVLAAFGFDAGNWREGQHLRMLADVNGDGRTDIVGFADNGVHLATSTTTGFEYWGLVLDTFGYKAGDWSIDQHPRYVADVNCDGRADLVGHGGPWTYVALSTGTGFVSDGVWARGYALNDGWSVADHLRLMGNIDGDCVKDIVGFKNDGVHVLPLVNHIERVQ